MDTGDECMESLWQRGTGMPQFPRLEGNLKTDVLIIGGGLTGLLCAHMLGEAGVDYTLVEADRICGGVTGNTTAKLTAQHGLIYHKLMKEFGPEQTKRYLQANLEAVARYRQLCRTLDCDFEDRDSWVYSVDRPQKLEREMEALQALGFPADYAETVPLPLTVAGAIRFKRQAQFHPLKFAAGIARGLRIYEHTAIRAFDGRAYRTDMGRILAEKAIVTTHFPLFNKHGSYFLKLYQHRSYVLALEQAPQVDGMYVDERKTGLSFRNAGNLLLLGGGAHRTGKRGGGWAELTAFSEDRWPEAREVCRWATQDCMSLDGIPYIGRYCAKTPDLYVATGFNKWGMTSAMVAATLLTELVQGRQSPCEALFSPSRTILQPQLAGNAAGAVLNLLTPTTPRCPHMGCALKWNRQERSWDCPCHGSRFSGDGRLLDNPATGDLKKAPKSR